MLTRINGPLYKLDSKGRVRVWTITVGDYSGVPYYSVSHGQDGGKLQETKVLVAEGKNLGRSNETTAQEQCLAEAKALYEKQRDRKGYTEAVPTEVPNLPMLAHKYKDYAHKISWPAITSQKIDGCRMIVSIKNGKAKCTSRTGKEFVGLEHITEELLTLGKNIVLDGELYSDLHSFEDIMSIVRKNKSTDPRMRDIFFYAFDIINKDTYHQRVVSLDTLVSGLSHTKIVPWFIVKSPEEFQKKHESFVADGKEGSMLRNINSLYQPNKRSYDLLKNKDFNDFEFEIVGWVRGKGRFENIPTFRLKTKDCKEFEAVPKGTAEDRLVYLNNADNLIGKMATVRFFEYTSDGIPRFPILIGIRDYE